MLKILIVTILFIHSASPALIPIFGPINCDQLKITMQVTNAEEGKENGKAEAKVEGGIAPIYYIFFLPNGHLLKKDMDVSTNSISNLKPGNYFCSVSDGAGCTKRVEFKIE
jgi:hypothetical protein